MAGKLCGDTNIQDAYQRYEITVHTVILDKVNQSLSQRFEKNRELYTDFSLLYPKRFDHLKLKGVPAGALNTLSANLTRHNSNATPAKLQAELLSLATNWASFSESVR